MAFHQIPSTFFARLGKFLAFTKGVQFERATCVYAHDYHGHGLGGVPRSRWRCVSTGGGGGVPRPPVVASVSVVVCLGLLCTSTATASVAVSI